MPTELKRNSSLGSESNPAATIDATTEESSLQSTVVPFLLLCIGLLALSTTAIFIKISVQEISAEATVFNRLWIATFAFTGWAWSARWRSSITQSPERSQSSELPVSESPAPPESTKSPELSQASLTLPADLPGERLRDRIWSTVLKWPWDTIALVIALGLVHLMGRYLWTWSLTRTTAANGAMLANMPPLFTALGGWFFLGQRFDQRFLTGLGVAVVGAIVLVLGDWLQPKEELFGVAALVGDGAALLSSVFYAASFLLVEALRQRLSTSNILVWRCAIGLAITIPITWAISDTMFPVSRMGWLAVIGLALISEVTGHGLIVYSLKHFSSAFVTLVLLLEPAPTAIAAWLLFGEFLDPLNIAGFVLITAGIYLAKTGSGSTHQGSSPVNQDNENVIQDCEIPES